MGEGWDVTFVTDASGGVSHEAHDLAVQRMIAAGANPMTWLAGLGEWQRDWARMATVPAFAKILLEHAGGSGVALGWEQQLLHAAKSAAA
jgi:nicotinamidase-related amidase